MYRAITVDFLRKNGETGNRVLSLGGGKLKEGDQEFALLVRAFARDELHTIVDIEKVQSFLTRSGYGLSNVIITDAFDAFEVEN